jgi:hypothetical protein
MIYPHHDTVSKDYQDLSVKVKVTRWLHQCSTRAAQDI